MRIACAQAPERRHSPEAAENILPSGEIPAVSVHNKQFLVSRISWAGVVNRWQRHR